MVLARGVLMNRNYSNLIDAAIAAESIVSSGAVERLYTGTGHQSWLHKVQRELRAAIGEAKEDRRQECGS